MEEAQVDSVQVEVDIQVRCERIPGESYVWVWWAWWGHRRGPVGEVYVLILGLTALCGVSGEPSTLGSFEPETLMVGMIMADNSLRWRWSSREKRKQLVSRERRVLGKTDAC